MSMYQIPVSNYEIFEKAIQKVNKRAIKLNLKPIQYSIKRTTTEKVKTFENSSNRKDYDMLVHHVSINQSESIKINGYQVVGVLERNVNEFIYKGLENVPQAQKELCTCEHCQTNRKRNKYYVLFNEEKQSYINVGKTCLIDFLGHSDGDKIASMFETINAIIKDSTMLSTIDFFNPEFLPLDNLLKIAIYCINKNGYVKSSNNNPTKNQILSVYLSDYPMGDRELRLDKKLSYAVADEKINELKSNILSLEPKNDFVVSCQKIIKDNFVKSNMLGFVAYMPLMISHFISSQPNKIERKTSSFVGEIGERMEKTLKYEKTFTYDGYFGTTYTHIFHDENENILVWHTSTCDLSEYNQGEEIMLVGTVKEHKVYQNKNQTILTRCKIKL